MQVRVAAAVNDGALVAAEEACSVSTNSLDILIGKFYKSALLSTGLYSNWTAASGISPRASATVGARLASNAGKFRLA
jgi:hypothetical protein